MSDGTYVIGLISEFNLNNYYAGILSIRATSSPACSPIPHIPSIRKYGWCRRPTPMRRFDYVVGLFYENQTRVGSWYVTSPGSPERAVAAGLYRAVLRRSIFSELSGIRRVESARLQLRSNRYARFHRQVGVCRAHLALHRPRADHLRRPAFRADLHRLAVVSRLHLRFSIPAIAAQLAGVEEYLEGQSVLRIQPGSVRLCDLVAGISARGCQLGSAGGDLQGKPAVGHLCSGFGQ